MKRIIIIVLSLLALVFVLVFAFKNEIKIQMENTFLSTAILIGDSFERDLIIEKYSTHDKVEYITLKDLDYTISSEMVDLDSSYVAFSNEHNTALMYITLIGSSKYKNISYVNVYKKDLSRKSITINKNTLEENLNIINAVKYKEV